MIIDCQLTFRRCNTTEPCGWFIVVEDNEDNEDNSVYYDMIECGVTSNHVIEVVENNDILFIDYFCDDHAIPAYIEHTDDNTVIQALSVPDSLVKKLRTENDYNDRGIVIEADGSSNVHEVLGDGQ